MAFRANNIHFASIIHMIQVSHLKQIYIYINTRSNVQSIVKYGNIKELLKEFKIIEKKCFKKWNIVVGFFFFENPLCDVVKT